jgi:hypothetical protein
MTDLVKPESLVAAAGAIRLVAVADSVTFLKRFLVVAVLAEVVNKLVHRVVKTSKSQPV